MSRLLVTGLPWNELLASDGILAAAYLGARVLSFLFGRILRAALRTKTAGGEPMVAALQRPFGQALFLVGAYFALHRLPVAAVWHERFDAALFVAFVLVLAIALVRTYAITLGPPVVAAAPREAPSLRKA